MEELGRPPRREWTTIYLKADAKAGFKARLKAAEAGTLTFPGMWKPITTDPELYEIRWSDVAVQERDPVTGILTLENVEVRLYYSEHHFDSWFLGLHGHEKVIVEGNHDETTRLQNAEIEKASSFYDENVTDSWGVSELRV